MYQNIKNLVVLKKSGKGIEGGNNVDTFYKDLTADINKSTTDHNQRMTRYAEEVEKLIHFIKKEAAFTHIYKSVCFLLDHNPMISWYIIVEPNEHSHNILSHDLLSKYSEFYKKMADANAVVSVPNNEKYGHLLDNVFTRSEVQPYIQKVNNLRNGLTGPNIALMEIPQKVINVYTTFVNDISNFPPGVEHIVSLYKKTPKLKLFHDELRYLYEHEGKFFDDKTAIDNLNVSQFSSSKMDNNLLLCNTNLYKHLIGPKHLLTCLDKFVKSTSFLYIPLDKETFNKYKETLAKAVGGSSTGCVIGMSGGSYRTGGVYTGSSWMHKKKVLI